MNNRAFGIVFAGIAALALSPVLAGSASASVVSDPTGDFLGTYTGPTGADLDVTSLAVRLSGSDFKVHTVLAGNVGTTAGGFYVYGVDRGGAGAPFLPQGLDKVLFNSVVIVRQDGSGLVVNFGGATTPIAHFATFNANTIDFTLSSALLPSTGSAADRYGWNLWPRSAGGPFAFISDFAPNNGILSVVPEPAPWAMMTLGIGLLGWATRRRARRSSVVVSG